MAKAITDRFSHIEVYGKKFTDHHNELIEEAVRKTIEDFLNWLHVKGYLPFPHTPFKEREWFKPGRLKTYSESSLYFAYSNYCERQRRSENHQKQK